MCRWLAYLGDPVRLADVLFEPDRSLIHQSLHARDTATTTNGDGFGVGWYGARETPGLYREVRPAWNDPNLRDLAAEIRSGLFLAHVRAATAGAVQHTNCHPFRHGRWLFQHNGEILGFRRLRRELALALREDLFDDLQGTTDSEVMFHLALTFGLEEDPPGALARMAGYVERIGRAQGIEHPLQMTLGLADGERLHAVRYASRGEPRSLHLGRGAEALGAVAPPLAEARDARLVVSEPLSSVAEAWEAIGPGTYLVVEPDGDVARAPFAPRAP